MTINININIDREGILEALDNMQLSGLGALLTDIYNNVVAPISEPPAEDDEPKPREWDHAHEIPVGTVVKGEYIHTPGYSRPWIRYSEDHLHFNPRAGDKNSKPYDRGHHKLLDGRFGVADSVYDKWVEIPGHELTFEPEPERGFWEHLADIPVGATVKGPTTNLEWLKVRDDYVQVTPELYGISGKSAPGSFGHYSPEWFDFGDRMSGPWTEVVDPEFTLEPEPEPRVFAHGHEIPIGGKVVDAGSRPWIRFTKDHLHYEPRPGDEKSTYGHRGHHRLVNGRFSTADIVSAPYTEVLE